MLGVTAATSSIVAIDASIFTLSADQPTGSVSAHVRYTIIVQTIFLLSLLRSFVGLLAGSRCMARLYRKLRRRPEKKKKRQKCKSCKCKVSTVLLLL